MDINRRKKNFGAGTKRLNKKEKMVFRCISRESNTGPIDGNDGFYH